ncbi:cold shock domain-containing protein [Paenibacillus sp.]|uniref:cold-shock protein n=1 Tax=Paenibacillus sp. TaxID=58172 RepID=UPI002D60B4FE|nr:cold shock domain-containing protein [Paenibacillus sp.]HZG87302.1 cold shock domain-containing protein [Paenibacillus sp.]
MVRGKVKFFDDTKGWGFISGDNGDSYFVHHRDICVDGWRTLSEGQLVEFDVETTDRGRKAANVYVIVEG